MADTALAHLILQSEVLLARLLEAILGVEHYAEVFAAGVQDCTVRSHQMLPVQLEDHVEKVVKVTALHHLRMDDVVLLLNAILGRLNHRGTVKLVKLEADRVE